MEYINFGKVVNVSASVPVAVNDTAYHIIIDFVPNCPEIFDSFHTDMGKILEWPDDYVLCNVSDIKELEDLGADLNEHIKNLERIKEFLINGNTTLIDENSKLKATNQALKDRIKELETEKNTWKEKCGSVITDTFRVLSSDPFGVKFNFDGWNEDGNWLITMDFPELDEAKKKISELEQKLEAAKSNEKYWCNRKEEEEDHHYYWYHNFDRAVKQAADKGVCISITGRDEDCNAGIVVVKNNRAEELEVKNGDLFNERGVLQAKLVKRGTELECVKSENSELKKKLKDLKRKNVAEVRYEWKPNCFTVIYTMRDGSKQTTGMDLADDIDEKCTMGAFVCHSFNIPQCKNCKNHRYFGNSGHYCHLPDSKYKIPGMFNVNPLTDEEAEGPACDKFEARKE